MIDFNGMSRAKSLSNIQAPLSATNGQNGGVGPVIKKCESLLQNHHPENGLVPITPTVVKIGEAGGHSAVRGKTNIERFGTDVLLQFFH
jgi:hypothetical protein